MHTSAALPRLPEKRILWVVSIGIALLSLAVYFVSLGNEFVAWDDLDLIVNNPAIHSITAATLKHIFSSYDPELYIPLTLLSYQVDYLFAGADPSLFHLHSLVLHIIASLLVGWLALLLSRDRTVGFVVMALFAVHPLHADAVAWVSGRKDVQAGMFMLASFVSYCYYLGKHQRAEIRGNVLSSTYYVISLGFFALALLSKISAVTLPFILLLIDWREGRRGAKKLLFEKLPFVVLAIPLGIVALFGKTQFLTSLTFFQNVLLAGRATLFYLSKVFVPIRLSLLYPYTSAIAVSSWDLTLSVAAVMALSVGAWLMRRRFPDIAFGWAFFLLCLLPAFVQFTHGDDIGDIYLASDRYAYVASFGMLYVVALLLARSMRPSGIQRAIAVVSAGVIALVFCVLTFQQSLTWRNTETLFRHVLTYYPNSQVAHVNIGNYYQLRGDFNKAVDEYQAALEIRPTALAYFNLGRVFLRVGMYDGAIEENQEALKLDPNASMAQLNIGAALVKMGRNDEAIAAFQKAANMDPAAMEPHVNLGLIYERQGRTGEAIHEYSEALARSPQVALILGKLASLSLRTGDQMSAEDYAVRAINIDPNNQDARAVLQKLRQ